MVEKYKAYPEYKDSGVKWLGKIPSNWSVIPLKRYFSIINGSTPKSGNDNFWNGDIIWITPSDLSKLTSFDIINSIRKITKSGLASCGTSIVPINSIILSCRAPIGSIGLAKVELCTNQGCKSLVPFQDSSSYFYAYVLSICTEELNAKGKGTTFLELSNDELGYFSLPKPTIKEQRNIVIFLDYETYKIDTLIKQQQQLIKLLEEKRQAVISHAVTKGLNPNVSMKESEIDWVKNIPYHWGKTPMRWSTKIFSGGTPSKNKEEYWENGTIPWLNSGSVNQKKITTPSAYITKKGYLYSSAKWIPRNSLVIALAGQGKTKGMVAIVDIDTTCNQSMGAIIPNKNKFITTYLYYWLLINYQNIRNLSGGDLRDGLNLELIADIECPMPPLEEQEKICSFIEKEIFIINQLNDKTNQVIDLLKEHRTALISAAVTGKIDVRNWQAPTVTD
ncbi:restriction endonuclease subunit S [Snodgrassella sp. M0351]|uniref:restriction endonuclease subunit S n=1 Tax=Snodgrassella sp. M0351 TaxID=2751012 RepID=UPI0018DE36D4|nr:restriction endonuclease subunit S [Snodgrassella sp. M0351]MBI0165128.1 restriction endonuclease subunit S [Snodgrassella sp. M0351]